MNETRSSLFQAILALFLLLLPPDAIDQATRAALLEIIPAVVCLLDGGHESRSRRDNPHRTNR